MNFSNLLKYLENEDFLIRVRPFTDGKQEWTGEVDLSVVTSPENDLDDESYFQIMHFCKMMCAAIPIMEENEEFRNIVHNYVEEYVDSEPEISVELDEPEEVKHTSDGNVITINFGTATKGNA